MDVLVAVHMGERDSGVIKLLKLGTELGRDIDGSSAPLQDPDQQGPTGEELSISICEAGSQAFSNA